MGARVEARLAGGSCSHTRVTLQDGWGLPQQPVSSGGGGSGLGFFCSLCPAQARDPISTFA